MNTSTTTSTETPIAKLRRAHERGHANHGWLDSYHSFAFADYYDPKHMGFRVLRVINEDRVDGGQGFGTHGHRDMEIISYVLDGALSHKDSLGTGSTLRRGDVQRMSAGTGVRHSEFNGSQKEKVHFLQIWILPERAGVAPSYEEAHVGDDEKRGRLAAIAAPAGAKLTIHQDVSLFAGLFSGEERAEHAVRAGRHVYVHVARGAITVASEAGEHRLSAGDAVALSAVSGVRLHSGDGAEVLLFDLP